MHKHAQIYIFLAWLIALAALLSTLYLSEILAWPVCHLCWYQRITTYPLVIILGIGAYLNDSQCIRYALPFPILSFLFALYQYLEQMIPGFSPIRLCSADISCSQIHVKIAGFITLPLMGALASALIILLLWIARRH